MRLMYSGYGTAMITMVEAREMIAVFRTNREMDNIFTSREMACCGQGRTGRPLERLAGRLAAKRAVWRALGLGGDNPDGWAGIEILPSTSGEPRVYLHGKLKSDFFLNSTGEIQVSISHGEEIALAVAIIKKV